MNIGQLFSWDSITNHPLTGWATFSCLPYKTHRKYSGVCKVKTRNILVITKSKQRFLPPREKSLVHLGSGAEVNLNDILVIYFHLMAHLEPKLFLQSSETK